jgi:LysR family hydrogen peroxide-inducible transcriptional activator
VELHQLRYFVAVAEEGSFTRAAERCEVTQPALSQQIGKLEAELGRPLFDRTGRKTTLTEVGAVLLDEARIVLAALDHAQERMRQMRTEDGGRVTLGVIPTVAPYLCPPLLVDFARKHPRVEVVLTEDFTERVLAGCLTGDLDLVVCALPVEDGRLHVEPLFGEELYLAMPSDHPLKRADRITLERLSHEPFVLLSEIHCLGGQTLAFCQQPDFRPPVRCKTAQLTTVLQLVALGHGVSIIPAMATSSVPPEGWTFRSISPEPPRRTLCLVWRKERYQGRAVRALITALREEGARRTETMNDER